MGTPFSFSSVTAASPVPVEVSSSSTSYSSETGYVFTAAESAFWSSGVNARSACCTRLPSCARTLDGTSFGDCVTK